MSKVLFAAAEAAPFYKTGGLGDVAFSLPKALNEDIDELRVVIPYYEKLFPAKYKKLVKDWMYFQVQVGNKPKYCGIKTLELNGLKYYLIDNEEYFGRDNLYGYWDDGERFAFFQLAICEMMEKIDFIPDVLHLNDWHTAFIPVLLKDKYSWIQSYAHIKTVLTIHNIQFQGVYDPIVLGSLFGIGTRTFDEGSIEFFGNINFMKGGITFADAVTTVSPRYASEIQTPEFGEHLEGILQDNSYKLQGIVNGIDMSVYDPATDPSIPYHFDAIDTTNKIKDKHALQKMVRLPEKDVPIFAVVSRLTRQKGMDLLLSALNDFLKSRDVQVIILGTGDKDLEDGFLGYQDAFHEKLAAKIQFDVKLAQMIYAGSDVFLMPSAFEPCGLSQMMAMRYGSVPLVHSVGGLSDTVTPYNKFTKVGTGFGFDDYRFEVLKEMMDSAFELYHDDPKAWGNLRSQGMEQDFSWHKSAKKYRQLYQELAD
ncbi:glycogen synthase GlgA [Companilactobacillus allii]|uniref:Glycogen synthase n=1 Tax=Companilactobacillus allii TaxID=1847728 RepID=A0A1P8Q1E7_9LACO|nr:glycogen synthase GlgA [Companilactobacillus allii]APX71704.1 starch synthase [Companilactobacillus allii]USQ68792.1 glycogen synthase GlgA [Companilactobacillus allii]